MGGGVYCVKLALLGQIRNVAAAVFAHVCAFFGASGAALLTAFCAYTVVVAVYFVVTIKAFHIKTSLD